jgi:hypothetical protein
MLNIGGMPCLRRNISVTAMNVAEIFGAPKQCYILYQRAKYEAHTCANARERRQPRARKIWFLHTNFMVLSTLMTFWYWEFRKTVFRPYFSFISRYFILRWYRNVDIKTTNTWVSTSSRWDKNWPSYVDLKVFLEGTWGIFFAKKVIKIVREAKFAEQYLSQLWTD